MGTSVAGQSECSQHSLPGPDVPEAVFPRISRNHGNRDVSRGAAAHPAGQEKGLYQMPPSSGTAHGDPQPSQPARDRTEKFWEDEIRTLGFTSTSNFII